MCKNTQTIRIGLNTGLFTPYGDEFPGTSPANLTILANTILEIVGERETPIEARAVELGGEVFAEECSEKIRGRLAALHFPRFGVFPPFHLFAPLPPALSLVSPKSIVLSKIHLPIPLALLLQVFFAFT